MGVCVHQFPAAFPEEFDGGGVLGNQEAPEGSEGIPRKGLTW